MLVLDCYNRMGLAVVNSLDPAYELVGGAPERPGLERVLRSPRLSEFFRYPRPNTDPEGFGRAILEGG